MATQEELTEQLAIDLGITIGKKRLPYAKEVFKSTDMDLLPRSSEDTLLGEQYEWSGRQYRSLNTNIIGFLYDDAGMDAMREQLSKVRRVKALVPSFEFNKDHLIELGGTLPSIFDLQFSGKLKTTKELTVTVSDVLTSRITNYEDPGREIRNRLSAFAESRSKAYRKSIKRDYVAEALFYATSVEIALERGSDMNVDFSFESTAKVEVLVENEAKKRYRLSYKGNAAPFAAKMRQGSDLLDRW